MSYEVNYTLLYTLYGRANALCDRYKKKTMFLAPLVDE